MRVCKTDWKLSHSVHYFTVSVSRFVPAHYFIFLSNLFQDLQVREGRMEQMERLVRRRMSDTCTRKLPLLIMLSTTSFFSSHSLRQLKRDLTAKGQLMLILCF